MLELPVIRVAGTVTAMGHAYGRAVADLARAFVHERARAARAYLYEKGIRDQGRLLELGRACLARLADWDAEGHAEHLAVAAGAGIDAAELYTAGNYTDLRDIIALGDDPSTEGCSTLLLPTSATGGPVVAGQTWDLNPGDLAFVVAVHRFPHGGAPTFAITCAGCPSLIGMNAHGLAVGTTNIKTRGARLGIPYLSLLHRLLRCHDRAEARSVIEGAPLAAAHTYWAADAGGVEDWERTPFGFVHRAGNAPLFRTNHCLAAAHRHLEGEPPYASSRRRLARLRVLAQRTRDAAGMRAVFADRADGVDSINRFPEDAQGTTTNACVITEPARRRIHACRGPADRGRWITVEF